VGQAAPAEQNHLAAGIHRTPANSSQNAHRFRRSAFGKSPAFYMGRRRTRK
jgi:hypothetical protein